MSDKHSQTFYNRAALDHHLLFIPEEIAAGYDLTVNFTTSRGTTYTLSPRKDSPENERKKDFETGFKMPPPGYIPSFMK